MLKRKQYKEKKNIYVLYFVLTWRPANKLAEGQQKTGKVEKHSKNTCSAGKQVFLKGSIVLKLWC